MDMWLVCASWKKMDSRSLGYRGYPHCWGFVAGWWGYLKWGKALQECPRTLTLQGNMNLNHNPVATLVVMALNMTFHLAGTASVFTSSTDCYEILNHFCAEYNVPIPRNLSVQPPPPHLCASLFPTSSSQSCILWTLRPVWVKYLWPIHLPLLFNITTCLLFSQPSFVDPQGLHF